MFEFNSSSKSGGFTAFHIFLLFTQKVFQRGKEKEKAGSLKWEKSNQNSIGYWMLEFIPVFLPNFAEPKNFAFS